MARCFAIAMSSYPDAKYMQYFLRHVSRPHFRKKCEAAGTVLSIAGPGADRIAKRVANTWTNFEQKLADTIYDTITFARTKAPVQQLRHARWGIPQEPGPQRGVESPETQPSHSFLQCLQQTWPCVIVYRVAAIRQQGQAGLGG